MLDQLLIGAEPGRALNELLVAVEFPALHGHLAHDETGGAAGEEVLDRLALLFSRVVTGFDQRGDEDLLRPQIRVLLEHAAADDAAGADAFSRANFVPDDFGRIEQAQLLPDLERFLRD